MCRGLGAARTRGRGSRRCGGRRWCCCGCFGRCRCRLGARRGAHRCDGRRHHRRLLHVSTFDHFSPLPEFRGIEQEGVLTHELARSPVQFDQKIDERLIDRLDRRDAHERAAVVATIDGKAQAAQRSVELEPRLPEGIRRREPCIQRRGLFARQRGDLDLGTQWLTQRRLHGQPAEAGSPGRPRSTRHEGERDGGSNALGRRFGNRKVFGFLPGSHADPRADNKVF